MELHYAARDLFDLWRAVVAEHAREQLENDATTAAVFHNDCSYIAYHLLTLGFAYNVKLMTPVNESSSFVDMVPPFRKLGQQYFQKQMV